MKALFLCLQLLLALAGIAQSTIQSFTIVPEKDFFYLKNWNVDGKVRSITVKTHQPRNPATRFQQMDDCRQTAKSYEKFTTQEEKFDFNHKGLLMKRTTHTSSGKIITLFSYNYDDKIESIESGEKSMLFHYDRRGNLELIQNFRGAKLDSESERRVKVDTIITITRYHATHTSDSLVEVLNPLGQMIYSAFKTETHPLKEDFAEYDAKGHVIKKWNSLGAYFEYEYDDQDRVIKTYTGHDRAMLVTHEYEDETGISKMSRYELVDGEYIKRNYECLCTVIDGQNNTIKCEHIDCSNSPDGDLFALNGFYEIAYEYGK